VTRTRTPSARRAIITAHADGQSSRAVAARYGISHATVLGTAELAMLALRKRIYGLPRYPGGRPKGRGVRTTQDHGIDQPIGQPPAPGAAARQPARELAGRWRAVAIRGQVSPSLPLGVDARERPDLAAAGDSLAGSQAARSTSCAPR
jgi:hypothetical protein